MATKSTIQALSHSLTRSQPNKSVEGAMNCLLYVLSQPSPIGCKEVANALNMDTTRANRLLGTLTSLGFLEQKSNRKYRSGPGIHILTAMANQSSVLIHEALPHIKNLYQKTGMRVALGVLWQTNICYIYHGSPEKNIYEGIGSHELFPALDSSIGHILLSFWPDEEVIDMYQQSNTYLSENLETFLLQHLKNSREKGYGQSRDGKSIAVSIGTKPVAGLALLSQQSDPAFTDSMIENILPHLKAAADLITEKMD